MPRPRGLTRWLLCLAGAAESRRGAINRALVATIRVIHRESRETYGSPSIWDALIKQGHGVGEHRVARLMRQEGIRAKTVKKWRATTQSNHRLPVALNTRHPHAAPGAMLLEVAFVHAPEFNAFAPGQAGQCFYTGFRSSSAVSY